MEFLSEPEAPDQPINILLHPDLKNTIIQKFQERNFTFNLLSNNFSGDIARERDEIYKRRTFFESTCNKTKNGCLIDFFNYNELATIQQYIFSKGAHTNHAPLINSSVIKIEDNLCLRR